jgi:hypothetical protein
MLIHTCHAHAALCRGLEKSLSEGHGGGMARARHGVNQTRPHCVNQMGKNTIKTFSGTAWAQHGNGVVCVN